MLVCQHLVAAAAPGLAQPVLHEVSLRLEPGAQVALIGPSGAGKTTLLHCLALAQPLLAGQLHAFATEPWRLSHSARHALRAQLCLAPQQSPMPARQRVVTAVLAGRLPRQSLWQSLRTLWNPPEAHLAYEALCALDVGEKLWLRVDELSGGERQRVGLARLLVSEARLWLVDEPLAALDPTRAEVALRVLQARAAEQGRTLVCSLHQVALAKRCFARVLALREGRVWYDGPAEGLSDAMLSELYAGEQAVQVRASASQGLGLPIAMCR